MYTLSRPLAAVALGFLAWFLAHRFAALNTGMVFGPGFFAATAVLGALIGWLFLGGRIGHGLAATIWNTAQALVLVALAVCAVSALGSVSLQGPRGLRPDPVDAVAGMFDRFQTFLRAMIDFDFLVASAVGGLIAGLVLHVTARLLERRRTRR